MNFLYKTDPLPHQKETLEQIAGHENYALFWEMGLGKSKVVIDNVVALYGANRVHGAILFSDKGNYLNWKKEIEIHCAMPSRVFVYAAGKDTKLAPPIPGTVDFLLINTEALSTSRTVRGVIDKFVSSRRVLACIDEATSIKGATSARSKTAFEVRSKFAYRRILTGTPLCQSPLDIFGQFRFLQPSVFGTSFYPFRARFADLEENYLPGGKTFKKVVGYKNRELMTSLLKPYCSRLMKADCLNLPEKIYTVRTVEHTPEQKKILAELMDFSVAALSDGRIATAATALSLMNKLHQLNMGRLASDDGVIHPVRHNRLEELGRILEEHDGKAIIWCAYQKDVQDVMEKLGDEAVSYYGPMSQAQRQEALAAFLEKPEVRFFVATPDTAGKSLTLVVANLVIYYSCGFKLEHRLQSEDRAHRHGQTRSVTYVDMVCPGTVDEEILENLTGKKDMAASILDALKHLVSRR